MQLFAISSLYLLLVSIKLLLFLSPVHPDHLADRCDGLNYTVSSTFDQNLRTLLSSLSANGKSSGFYSGSFGENQNLVYGLALCRGDITASTCGTCLDQASDEVSEECPNRKEAIIWYQHCLIHYSDRKFFGNVDIDSEVLMWNGQNASEMDNGLVDAKPLMYGLVNKTTVAPLMFAVGNASFGEWGTRYGLMQCTRDLSRDGCRNCLEGLMSYFERCCVGKKSWQILGASCRIRYDAYHFYEERMGADSQGESVPHFSCLQPSNSLFNNTR